MKNFFYYFLIILLSILISPAILSQEKDTKRKKTAEEREMEREGRTDSLKYEIQEMTVTGTRSQEKIIDIPFSVFRVDRKELGYGKKVSAKDVLADVPGLFLQSRYGNHDLRISLRGFGTRSNSGVRGVRILQDGIPESEPDGETVIDAVDLTTLGGVEVVKGNLSSLYANAPGGVINFISDMFFPKDYFGLIQQAGRFGFRQTGIKMGLQSPTNRFLLTYNYRNMDGFRAHSTENQHLLNMIYENYLGKGTFTVMGNFVKGMIRLPGSLTEAEFQANPFMANPDALTNDFRRITGKGRLGLRYKTTFGEENNHEVELTAYGGIKELEKADMNRYSYASRYNVGIMGRYTNRSVILQHKNVLTGGVDYAYQSGPITAFDIIAGNQGLSVLDEYNPTLSNIGLYVMEHFNVVEEKLDLFLSGRMDNNTYINNIFIPKRFVDTTIIFTRAAPKAALNFKLTPNIALYTSYGVGYDFPALSELGNTSFQSNLKYSLNSDLKVQKSYNFEFGIKGNIVRPGEEFMRKLFFEATFFDYVINDEIVPNIINYVTYFSNAAKTNRRGVEIGVKSHPFEGIEFTVNYTITDFKYDKYIAHIFTPTVDSTANYSGNIVPSVPGNILNLILNYEYEIGDEFSGLLQWDCDYISKMYVNDANTGHASPYFYGNMMAGLNYSTDLVNAILYIGVNNIFDKRYSGFVNINDFYNRSYETGEPRTYYAGINLSYKF